jgi:hypothetical protein
MPLPLCNMKGSGMEYMRFPLINKTTGKTPKAFLPDIGKQATEATRTRNELNK